MVIKFKELIHKIKIRLGWVICHECNSFVRFRWEKDWIYDPEEPPMFYHYECPKCCCCTDVLPTTLTIGAIKRLGFKSIDEYIQAIEK